MGKILDEVRQISSDAIAQKQDSAKVSLPKLLSQIKGAAAIGKKECIFSEYEIDEYVKKLLEAEGFCVRTTRQQTNDYKGMIIRQSMEPVVCWAVTWF